MVSLLMPLVRKTSKTFECQAPRVRGHKYWQAGKVFADHEADCDCDMMRLSLLDLCVGTGHGLHSRFYWLWRVLESTHRSRKEASSGRTFWPQHVSNHGQQNTSPKHKAVFERPIYWYATKQVAVN